MKRTLTPEQIEALRAVPILDGMPPNKLRIATTMLGITQVELAARADLHETFISDIARGMVKNCSLDTAHKIAAVFGCAIEDIFPAREAVA
jgi:DNA-binding XRE family transcriptional regulator